MITLTKKIFSLRSLNSVFLLSVLALTSACGSSDSSKAKRNSDNLYRIHVRSGRCPGVELQRSFTSHQDLCAYVSNEIRNNSCLYMELTHEYNRYNCNSTFNGGQTPIVGGEIPTPQQPVFTPTPTGQPQIIKTNSTYWQDEYRRLQNSGISAADQAITDYYILYNECTARIKGIKNQYTDGLVDLCIEQGTPSYEKDAPYTGSNYGEKDAPYIPEKDDVYPTPSKPSTPKTTTRPTTPATPSANTPSTPAPKTSTTTQQPGTPPPPANQLDHNLIHVNDRSFLIQEIGGEPVLQITASGVDSKSPIYQLKLKDTTSLRDIHFTNISTECPLKAQLRSGDQFILKLLIKAGSTTEQKSTCKAFFNNLPEIDILDFSFETPLIMENGLEIKQPFKLVRK